MRPDRGFGRFCNEVLVERASAPISPGSRASHIVVPRPFTTNRGLHLSTCLFFDRRCLVRIGPSRGRFYLAVCTTDLTSMQIPAGFKPDAARFAYLFTAANRFISRRCDPTVRFGSGSFFRNPRAPQRRFPGWAQDVSSRLRHCTATNAGCGSVAYGSLWRQDHGPIDGLAEEAIDQRSPSAGRRPDRPLDRRDSHLPGGELPHDGVEALVAETCRSATIPDRGTRPRLLGRGLLDTKSNASSKVRQGGSRISVPASGADLTSHGGTLPDGRELAQTEGRRPVATQQAWAPLLDGAAEHWPVFIVAHVGHG